MDTHIGFPPLTMAVFAGMAIGAMLLDMLTHHFQNWRLLLQPWLATKLTGVVVQTGYHHFLSRNRKRFAKNQNIHGEKFWRMVNEVPFVVAVVMVIAVTMSACVSLKVAIWLA